MPRKNGSSDRGPALCTINKLGQRGSRLGIRHLTYQNGIQSGGTGVLFPISFFRTKQYTLLLPVCQEKVTFEFLNGKRTDARIDKLSGL